MRRARHGLRAGLVAAAALAVALPATASAVGWGDTAVATGGGVSALRITTPVLTCTNTTSTSVTVTWPAQATAVSLGYTASIGTVAFTPQRSGDTWSVVVSGNLLTLLAAGTLTLSVTGTAPPTSWTSGTATVGIRFTLLGQLVSCA